MPWITPVNRRPVARLLSSGWSVGSTSRPSALVVTTPIDRLTSWMSTRRRPSIRSVGTPNIATNASLSRTTTPSASTIMTPSTSESMMVAWRRSASRARSSRALRSVTSRMWTTIPPIESSRWLAAMSSMSIQLPSAPAARSSSDTVRRSPATISSKVRRSATAPSSSRIRSTSNPTAAFGS